MAKTTKVIPMQIQYLGTDQITPYPFNNKDHTKNVDSTETEQTVQYGIHSKERQTKRYSIWSREQRKRKHKERQQSDQWAETT